MIKKNVLITPEGIIKVRIDKRKFYSKEINYFFTAGIISSKNLLCKKLKKMDGCIIGSEIIDKEVIDKCLNLKVICRFGVGLDNIDLVYAKKKGISVHNVIAKSVPNAVAVHATSLILAITQNLKNHIDDSKKNIWRRHLNNSPSQTKVGVYGAGKIGSIVIKNLISLNFKVFYTSRIRKKPLEKYGAKFCKNIDELIKKSDIISIHWPKIINSKPIFNLKRLKSLKGKSLINTSRGSLVDERLLLVMLNNKFINIYATDVLTNEPPIGLSKKIASHSRVISTAHVGGYNQLSLTEVSEKSLNIINKNLTS